MDGAIQVALYLLLFSFLPPFIYVVIIRNTERYGREPWSQIAKTFLFGAVFAVIISFILYIMIFTGSEYFENRFITVTKDPSMRALILVVIVAPFIEELAKGIGVLTVTSHITEPEDGLVYGSSCGLGFAATENFLYGLTAYIIVGLEASILVILVRSVSSALLHASASAFTGYGVGKSVVWGQRLQIVPFYLLAVLMHGAFNFVAYFSAVYQEAGAVNTGWILLLAAILFAITAIGITRSAIIRKDLPT